MDPHYHVAALHEVYLLMSGAQYAHCDRAGAVVRYVEGGDQRPKRRPDRRVGGVRTAIKAVADVVVVIKQVHTVVLITEEHVQLRTTALRSA